MRRHSLHVILLCGSLCACSDDSSVVTPGREAGLPDITTGDRPAADRARPDGSPPREAGKPDRTQVADRTLVADLGLKLVLKGPCDPKCPPRCDAIGSKSEGWYTCAGTLIGWTLCSKCPAPSCQFAGSSTEGWYSACTN